MHVTSDMAKLVLPILAAHAASLLEKAPGGDQRRADLAHDLRAAKAGGNAIEGLAQNTDDEGHETFPEELDTFWRVLVTFEENALGGSILRGGTIDPPRNGIEQPAPWMLNAAANVIELAAAMGDQAALDLADLASDFHAVDLQPCDRIHHA
jgi:hypothetical protein